MIKRLLTLLAIGITPAEAFQFSDFASTEGLRLNGATRVVREKVLRLVPPLPNRRGSVFTDGGVGISSFSTRFAFRIARPRGTIPDCRGKVGGDGLVFVMQARGPGALGVNAPGSIGYDGLMPSFGVEFDTYCDESRNDPNSNHIGLVANGVNTHGDLPVVPIGTRFDNGRMRYVWIDYDGATLEVRISALDARPELPQLSYGVDIPTIVGGDICCVGFTSGTSQSFGSHEVTSWEYLEEDDDDDDDDSRLAMAKLDLFDPKRTPALICRNRVIVN